MQQNQELVAILREAIEKLHDCQATWAEAVDVTEFFDNHLPWLGVVQVFDITGHQTAARCYAWGKRLRDSEQMGVVAILHEGWVDSPQKAVRISVLTDKDPRQTELENVEFNIEQLESMGQDYPRYEEVMKPLQDRRTELRNELGLT